MNRRDILRRIERLEAIAKARQRTRPAFELHLEGMTAEEVAHLARWTFEDYRQPMPADIARLMTLATGIPWQAGEVFA